MACARKPAASPKAFARTSSAASSPAERRTRVHSAAGRRACARAYPPSYEWPLACFASATIMTVDVDITVEILRAIREDIGGLRSDVTGLKSDMAGLKSEVAEVRTDLGVTN